MTEVLSPTKKHAAFFMDRIGYTGSTFDRPITNEILMDFHVFFQRTTRVRLPAITEEVRLPAFFQLINAVRIHII